MGGRPEGRHPLLKAGSSYQQLRRKIKDVLSQRWRKGDIHRKGWGLMSSAGRAQQQSTLIWAVLVVSVSKARIDTRLLEMFHGGCCA